MTKLRLDPTTEELVKALAPGADLNHTFTAGRSLGARDELLWLELRYARASQWRNGERGRKEGRGLTLTAASLILCLQVNNSLAEATESMTTWRYLTCPL